MPPRGVYVELLGDGKDISRMVPNKETRVDPSKGNFWGIVYKLRSYDLKF